MLPRVGGDEFLKGFGSRKLEGSCFRCCASPSKTTLGSKISSSSISPSFIDDEEDCFFKIPFKEDSFFDHSSKAR